MDAVVETITRNGFSATIEYDQTPSAGDPRDADNLGTIITWHRNYSFGEQDGRRMDVSPVDFRAELDAERALVLPVFMYEHSGIRLSTGSFGDPWDSGQVGFIYVSRADVLKEYSASRMTPKVKKQALAVLKGEIEAMDLYVSGQVYGYRVIDAEGEETDACWGFLGLDYIREEVNAILDNVPHTLPLPEPQVA
jgi:hypothetical protein